MKKIIILLFLSLTLISCWDDNNTEKKETSKQDFIIETKKMKSFDWNFEIEKTWKISPSQDIILSSKAWGRVSSISVKFWDKVTSWKRLINLTDNVSNYWLNLEKTNLSVEASRLTYESSKISLDKTVSDAKINLEKLSQDYEILEKTILENEKSSQLNLDQSKTSSGVTTSSSIQLDKLDNSIKKAELDYNNLLKSNKEQISALNTTSENDFINLKNIYSDIINLWDWILWVTDLNKRKNDSFEDYLWLKDSMQLKLTEDKLLDLIDYKENKLLTVDWKNMEEIYSIWGITYPKLIDFLDKLYLTLDNSIENIYFTSTQISWYKTQISWFKTSASWNYTSFLNTKTSKEKFINTYKDTENSTYEQIKLLKNDRELLAKNLYISWKNAEINFNKNLLNNESQLNWLKISLKNAKASLDNSIKNRTVTLKQLSNQIKLSQNTKNLAYSEYSKLLINSPIKWVVSEILVDKWVDVNPWTPLIKLSSIWDNEIEISLSFNEIELIKIWTKVKIIYLDKELNGTISSISPIADDNLNYRTKISVDSKVNISWNIAKIIIPVNLKEKLINLSLVKVTSEKQWEISIYLDWNISKKLVNLWKFYWDKVEIISCVDLKEKDCNNLEIIKTDVSKFDESKFNIKIKK